MAEKSTRGRNLLGNLLLGLLGLVTIVLLYKEIIHSFQVTFVPDSAWYNKFGRSPPTFYFGKLLEFSLIYFFAFAAFFVNKNDNKESILRVAPILILIFFVLWKNYQSRYILPAIPFLIILGVGFFINVSEALSRTKNRIVKSGGQVLWIYVLAIIFAKLVYVNWNLSFSNDLCYF